MKSLGDEMFEQNATNKLVKVVLFKFMLHHLNMEPCYDPVPFCTEL